jgi:general secretion pathway protein J
VPPPANAAGFTLAEALVALFVFGLISTMILGVLTMQARADATLRTRIEAQDRVALAQNTLRERMTRMRQVTDARGTGDTIIFSGLPNQIEFMAPTYQAEGPHALHHFSLHLEQGNNLVLSSINERTSPQAAVIEGLGWAPLVLLDNVTHIDLDYFGQDTISGRDSWQQNWTQRGRLPKLIRMKLAFGRGDTRVWPVLMIRPAPQSRLPCRDDNSSRDCGEKS